MLSQDLVIKVPLILLSQGFHRHQQVLWGRAHAALAHYVMSAPYTVPHTYLKALYLGKTLRPFTIRRGSWWKFPE